MTQRLAERGTVVLLGVDLLALVSFVVVGLGSHHETGVLDLFARNAIPLVVSWCVVARILRTYRASGLAPMFRTWAVAVPIALVARSIWVGSPTGGRFLIFLLVAMTFTLLFLLAGRALVAVVARRRKPV